MDKLQNDENFLQRWLDLDKAINARKTIEKQTQLEALYDYRILSGIDSRFWNSIQLYQKL